VRGSLGLKVYGLDGTRDINIDDLLLLVLARILGANHSRTKNECNTNKNEFTHVVSSFQMPTRMVGGELMMACICSLNE
jgi:hypothetical protein